MDADPAYRSSMKKKKNRILILQEVSGQNLFYANLL